MGAVGCLLDRGRWHHSQAATLLREWEAARAQSYVAGDLGEYTIAKASVELPYLLMTSLGAGLMIRTSCDPNAKHFEVRQTHAAESGADPRCSNTPIAHCGRYFSLPLLHETFLTQSGSSAAVEPNHVRIVNRQRSQGHKNDALTVRILRFFPYASFFRCAATRSRNSSNPGCLRTRAPRVFTVEVVIAVGIVAISIVSVLSLLPSLFRQSADSAVFSLRNECRTRCIWITTPRGTVYGFDVLAHAFP